MNCTAFGLLTGIIGLAAFAWLNGKTQNALDDIAEVRRRTLRTCCTRPRRPCAG